jgi:hypothetical protein
MSTLKCLLVFIFAAFLAAFMPQHAFAGSIEEYRDVLTSSRAQLADAAALSETDALRIRNNVADALEEIRYVDMPSGPSLELNNTPLVQVLRDEDRPLADALAKLDAIRSTLDKYPLQDSTEAYAALQEATGERQREVTEARNEPLNRVLRSIGEFLATLLDGIFGGRSSIVTIAGLILLAVLAIFFGRKLLNNLSRESKIKVKPVEDDIPASSSEAIDRAIEFANAGDYRTAVRQLYLGSLLILDERGKLQFDRSLTNRETIRAIRKAGAMQLADALRPVVDYYDRVWYGFVRVEQHDFERFRAEVEAVRSI